MTPQILQINADHIINLSRVAMVRRKAGSTTLYFNTDNWSYNVTDDDGGERLWNYLTSIAQQLPDGSDTDTDAPEPDEDDEDATDAPLPSYTDLPPITYPTENIAYEAARAWERAHPEGVANVQHRTALQARMSGWVVFRRLPRRLGTAWPAGSERHRGTPEEIAAAEKRIRDAMKEIEIPRHNTKA